MGVKKVSIMELPTSSDIASMLLAMRDDKGNNQFIRYQDGNVSKSWLRHLIAIRIYDMILEAFSKEDKYPDVTIPKG